MTPFDHECPYLRCKAEVGSACVELTSDGRRHALAGFHEARLALVEKKVPTLTLEDLTPVERMVAILILEGHARESITHQLERPYGTVNKTITAITRKLGVSRVSDIALWMRETYYEPRSIRPKETSSDSTRDCGNGAAPDRQSTLLEQVETLT